jgi:CBS domain containing-hemolysin-like protein
VTALFLALAVLLIVLNGVFVAMEFAAVGARRAVIEAHAAEGGRVARTAAYVQRTLSLQLAACQIGITVASVALGVVAGPALADLIAPAVHALGGSESTAHTVAVIVALALVTMLHMVLGEMVPKNLAIAAPERSLLILALPLAAFTWVFRPVIVALNWLARVGLAVLRVRQQDELVNAATSEELLVMVHDSASEGLIEAEERALLTGALAFAGTDAGSVMVPLDEAVTVPFQSSVEDVVRTMVATGRTRIPVWSERPSDLMGFVHSKDLLVPAETAPGRRLQIALLRRLPRIDAATPLPDVLRILRLSRVHIAAVTRDGDDVGMLTLSDVFESLVGDLRAVDRAG